MSDNKCKSLRRWELAALLALCAALLICTWAQGRQNSISASLVRLHVVAVSDSDSEQRLKLRVRDAVLDYLGGSLSGADSPARACELIRADMEGIEQAARGAAEGRELSVTLSRESYPSRQYEGFTLPAGEYQSLRIIIGAGQGHNWWCIVFPPVCLDAVGGEELAQTMSGGDYAMISGQEGYELRFKALELWGELTEKLRRE